MIRVPCPHELEHVIEPVVDLAKSVVHVLAKVGNAFVGPLLLSFDSVVVGGKLQRCNDTWQCFTLDDPNSAIDGPPIRR